MTKTIDNKTQQFVVKTIRALLPKAAIKAFGSRITGSAKKYSDLDIALDNGQPLSLQQLAQLSERFAESDLAFKVDISDYHLMDQEFRTIVDQEAEIW